MNIFEPATFAIVCKGVLAFLFRYLPLQELGGTIMKHSQQRIIGNRVLWKIIREVPAILIVMTAVTLGVASRVWAAPFAYITNFNDSTVSVIDTATNTVIATVPVGGGPYGVAVHPEGTFTYVTNSFSDTVSVIDATTNTVVATVPVGTTPFGVAVHPAGTFVYVANGFSDNVSVIDTATNAVVATVPVGDRPDGVAVHPAGTFVYVVNFTSLSIIRTSDNQVVATVGGLGNFPEFVAVHPAGTFVYVVVTNDDVVRVINTTTNSIVATVPVGEEPRGVAVHPEGTFVYVANGTGDSVSVIDGATNTVIATVPVVNLPLGVAVHPAGTFVYVANGGAGANSVSVIDTSTNTVVANIPVGGFPFAIGQFVGPLPPILTVTIDIKPGSFPNSINLSSAGVIPVAILSSDTFDATTEVDPDTLGLAGAAVKMVGKSGKSLCHGEDVSGDGLPDLVCQFETAQFMIEPGDSIAVLEGETFGGTAIRGEDSINIVPD